MTVHYKVGRMARKRYRPEEIITKLQEAGILISQGNTVAVTIRKLGEDNIAIPNI